LLFGAIGAPPTYQHGNGGERARQRSG